MNKCHSNTELSSLEETRCQFNGGTGAIKLGIDVHQDFYVVVEQAGGSNPKPPQRFPKAAFLHWAAKLKSQATEVYAVYEACGFGFSLQRKLSALSIKCYVVCPQKLDEQNRRVKTDGLDAKALCLKLDRFVQGNRDALAIVRVPSEEEEQARAIHRQREQLVKARKQLEAQGRSLMVNHGLEPVPNWWKPRTFTALPAPQWMKELLANSQPILVALQQKIAALTVQLQSAASPEQPRGLGKMTSVVIDREIGDWNRFSNRRQIASYTGLCPGEYSSGNTRLQSCVTKHGNPRLRAALVELAWRLVQLPAQLPPAAQVAADPGQRRTGHWSRAQKSDRSRSTPVGRRSVENQNRPAPLRRVGINQLVKFEGNRKENTPKEKLKPLWNVGAARCLTCPAT